MGYLILIVYVANISLQIFPMEVVSSDAVVVVVVVAVVVAEEHMISFGVDINGLDTFKMKALTMLLHICN